MRAFRGGDDGWRRLTALWICVAALSASNARTPTPEPVTTSEDESARAEMHWTDLAGRPVSLGDRERIVVLSFWATWCEPCIGEWPDLIRLHDKFAPYGVEFIGAAADLPDQIEVVRDYVRRYEINFPVVLGATVEQMQSVGLRPAIPGTVVLTGRGHPFERDQHVINPQRIDAVLSRMLGLEEEEE